MKTKGYMGSLLRIDMSERKTVTQSLTDTMAELYVGGSGLGAKLLFDETGPETDPLGPENLLIFSVGPLTGTKIYNSNRFQVTAKSPLTGILGEANCGGYWGETFKKCGYDALVLTGKSEKPVYIVIQDNEVVIEDASAIWGKDTFETDRILKSKYGKTSQVAAIGPAGENGVLFATITTDGTHARAIGRCGLGTVMGSKNVKAIVVKGSKKFEPAKPDKVLELIRKISPEMVELQSFGEKGTSGGVENYEKIGNLPIKNWYQGTFPEGAKKISGRYMADTILTGKYHCGRCIVSCGRVVKAKGGPYDGQNIGGPEYETIGMLGSNCLVDDINVIAKANELCNRYGLDTISTGGVIGFAMEAYEKGLITINDLDGIDLTWGNGEALLAMIKAIASKKGFGAILSQGVKRAAKQIGGTASEFAIHVKGLEFPAHDPRAKMTVALGYATSNRGACHLQGFTHDYEEGAFLMDLGSPQLNDRFNHEGKAENVALMQNLMSMFDSLTVCKFALSGGITVKPLMEFLNYVTGWDLDHSGFLKTGERIFNLKRMYNTRLGISRKDDTLPSRILMHKRGGGSNALPPLNIMLHDYYQYRGWDEFGIPTSEKRNELGLDEDRL